MKTLIADKFSETHINRLNQLGCEVTYQPSVKARELPQLIGSHKILVVRGKEVSAETLKASDQLALVLRAGAGVNTIDVKTASARGIFVSNCPGKNSIAVAELVFALLLAIDRRIADNVAALRAHKWNKKEFSKADGVFGKTLGVVGIGRIGREVITRARAFGLQIHYHNRKHVAPQIEEDLEATYWESLDQMLARMDIISVNCPHTPATYHLLSARRLKLIRPEAFVVNTARGEVIDENALTRMIEAGDIAGAGLDVFEHEPAVNPKLVKLAKAGKVVILPHMGSATIEGRIDMGEKVIINIRTFMDGHRPPDRVLPSML